MNARSRRIPYWDSPRIEERTTVMLMRKLELDKTYQKINQTDKLFIIYGDSDWKDCLKFDRGIWNPKAETFSVVTVRWGSLLPWPYWGDSCQIIFLWNTSVILPFVQEWNHQLSVGTCQGGRVDIICLKYHQTVFHSMRCSYLMQNWTPCLDLVGNKL